MPTHFELRVNSAEEVHALSFNVDLAFVAGAVEATEQRVRNEFLGGLLRQVAVVARNVHPTDAELSNLSVGQWAELAHLEDPEGDVSECGPHGGGVPRP